MNLPSVIELGESGSGSIQTSQDGMLGREVELKWLAQGLRSYQEAETKAAALAPIYHAEHRRTRLDVRPIGNTWWELSAAYGNAAIDPMLIDPKALEGAAGGMVQMPTAVLFASTLSFDTTGETEHITQAWPYGPEGGDKEGKPIEFKFPDSDAPTMHGAINVDGESVQGVDVVGRAFSFNETWNVSAEELIKTPEPLKEKNAAGAIVNVDQLSLLQHLFRLSGTVNQKKFRDFEPGEVLFLGARGEMSRGQTMVAVTMSFSARKNRSQFMVGDVAVDSKNGWDHLWIHYEAEAAANVVVKKAKFVYVDQVYEYADWEPIGVGTTWSKFYLSKSPFNQ